MNYYKLKIAGLERQLPILNISDELSIASFVILGDQELVTTAAAELVTKLPEVDILLTAEAKGIPLVHELARQLGHQRYVVARKGLKLYMENPVEVLVDSITTGHQQSLYLDRSDADRLKGAKVAIVDDVISTGNSLKALEELLAAAGGELVCKAALLAEGDAIGREDIIYLEDLPLFPNQ
ncbi:MAG: phosphoribosyltransferase family protein [Eubacteriales bacterium]|nr:phosphoribosyltransferase family protein [Eubacteriales bacterium]